MRKSIKQKQKKKNLWTDIQRTLSDNEVILGISIGFFITALGILLLHTLQKPESGVHAAPDIQIEESKPQPNRYYEAPDRAVGLGKTVNESHHIVL